MVIYVHILNNHNQGKEGEEMGKVFSLMEEQAKRWQPPKGLPKDNTDLNNLTFEELNLEHSYLKECLKHLSERLAENRSIVRDMERVWDKYRIRKETLERKLVGVRRVEGSRRKATRETRGEYAARLARMTPAELDKEMEKLQALKEVS